MRVNPQLTPSIALVVVVIAACSSAGSDLPSVPVASPAAPSAAASVIASPPASPVASEPAHVVIQDGEPWIVYAWSVGEGHVGTRLIRPDGSDDHWASPDVPLPPEGWQIFQDWSPDGRRLAFTADDGGSDRDSWTRDLWISVLGRPDGVKVLDCVLPCQEYSWPAWSPDGRSIAYSTFDLVDGHADGSRLMALDVETGTTSELASIPGAEYIVQPRWSPDGRSLVVGIDRWSDTSTSSVPTGSAIAVIDLDAGQPAPRRLTDWDLWATYPDWHPNEDLILFAASPGAAPDSWPTNLYTIRADGSDLTALTDFTAPLARAAQPSWTPDGMSIIFTRIEGSGFGDPTIAMMDADGTNLRSAIGGTYRPGTHARLRPTP